MPIYDIQFAWYNFYTRLLKWLNNVKILLISILTFKSFKYILEVL